MESMSVPLTSISRGRMAAPRAAYGPSPASTLDFHLGEVTLSFTRR